MTATSTQQPTAAKQQTTKAVAKFENVAEQVLAKIERYQGEGSLSLPKDYSVENHMKSAWLILQNTKDRNGNSALAVCTKDSIANSLLDMVLQGLSVAKKQGYFIVYGNRLEFQRSYFGTVALAKRCGGIIKDPVANVIYEGDDFVYHIDVETGLTKVVSHEQKLENIDEGKIKGAYAIVTYPDGSKQVKIMTMQQIRAAWNQGATKGNSPAHKNFTSEMAKKTVINNACKMAINSSDDAWIYEGKNDSMDEDAAARQREATTSAPKVEISTEDVEYEDVTDMPVAPGPMPQPMPQPAPTDKAKPVDPQPGTDVQVEDVPY